MCENKVILLLNISNNIDYVTIYLLYNTHHHNMIIFLLFAHIKLYFISLFELILERSSNSFSFIPVY